MKKGRTLIVTVTADDEFLSDPEATGGEEGAWDFVGENIQIGLKWNLLSKYVTLSEPAWDGPAEIVEE
jgi:hypothetical protein